jgi:primosomal protein N'
MTADPGGLRKALENVRTYVRTRYPSNDPGWRTIEWMVESALTPEATAPDALREAAQSAIRLAQAIPHSVDVEQAGMQAEVVIATLRDALALTPEATAPDTGLQEALTADEWQRVVDALIADGLAAVSRRLEAALEATAPACKCVDWAPDTEYLSVEQRPIGTHMPWCPEATAPLREATARGDALAAEYRRRLTPEATAPDGDVFLYPASSPQGPRTPWQDGWNAGVEAALTGTTGTAITPEATAPEACDVCLSFGYLSCDGCGHCLARARERLRALTPRLPDARIADDSDSQEAAMRRPCGHAGCAPGDPRDA